MAGALGEQDHVLLAAGPHTVQEDDAGAALEVELALEVLGRKSVSVVAVAVAEDGGGLVRPASSLMAVCE